MFQRCRLDSFAHRARVPTDNFGAAFLRRLIFLYDEAFTRLWFVGGALERGFPSSIVGRNRLCWVPALSHGLMHSLCPSPRRVLMLNSC